VSTHFVATKSEFTIVTAKVQQTTIFIATFYKLLGFKESRCTDNEIINHRRSMLSLHRFQFYVFYNIEFLIPFAALLFSSKN